MSLKHAILAVLAHSDRTGYELTRKIEGSVAYFWPATHQQIYQELKKLAQQDLVRFREKEQKGKPDKKIYSLTAQGKKELKSWIALPIEPSPSKDGLLIKLFASHIADPDVLVAELSRHRELRTERLRVFREIERSHFSKRKLAPELEAQYMTLRRGIFADEAWLKWCDECLERLARSRS